MNTASFIEHSFLKPTTTITDIERVCMEAMQYEFAAVCIPPMFVKKAKALTTGTNVKVATVVGFPFGYNAIESKLAETVLAIVDGTDELNIMINLVALKNKDWQYLAKELNTLLTVIRKSEKIVKVIIEASVLTHEEIIACCDLYGAAGVDFIQVSSGFAEQAVNIEIVKLIRTHLANVIQLKSGDSVDHGFIHNLVGAGVTRVLCNDPGQFDIKNDGMIFEKEHINKN